MLKKPKLNADESAGEPAIDNPSTNEPTTNEPTTDEPTTNELTTDESTTDKPPTNEPASELTVFESIKDPAIIKHNIIEPLKSSRDVPRREDTNRVIARPVLVSPINKTIIGGIVDSNLPTITYADRIAILDEYFPKSAIDSRLLNGAVAPDEFVADTAY